MVEVSDSIWSDVLGHVRLNQPPLMRGWFAQLVPTELDSGVLAVRATNEAQLRYLERHGRAAFSEAAQAATGRLITVEFYTGGDENGDAASSNDSNCRTDEYLLLNADYTFENFVTGPCNRLAQAASRAVGDDPGRAYNPFFVHGDVGLGKTHLLQAICHTMRDKNPTLKFHYISCERFTNDFIEAVELGALHEFRYRYRQVDALVIDDVQFLAARERSQEEFFHTFNTLTQSQRQIILSADCSPAEIPSLEERLVSRFNSGLVAHLDRPCFETRMAIVQKMARLRCIELPDEVVRFVARRVQTNNREIEGALVKLDAISQTENTPIELSLAEQALGTSVAKPVTIQIIMETVARVMNVKVSELQGKRRSKSIVYPRQVCMHLARKLTALSLEQIGGYFGGRDHTTVLHAHRTIEKQVASDASVRAMVEEIETEARQSSG